LVIKLWKDPTFRSERSSKKRLVWKLTVLKSLAKRWYKESKQRKLAKLETLETEIRDSILRLVDDPTNIEEGGLLRLRELERNELLRGQEELWRLRSRAIWLSSGDSNTKKIHRVASNNRSRKHIWEISDDNGQIYKDQETIKATTSQHFKTFYKAGVEINIIEQLQLVDLYPQMVSEEESITLFKPVTLEELKQVLFHFKKEKSPGPDGWSS
jgi:hypothetical protein